jgi:hypothetical protein
MDIAITERDTALHNQRISERVRDSLLTKLEMEEKCVSSLSQQLDLMSEWEQFDHMISLYNQLSLSAVNHRRASTTSSGSNGSGDEPLTVQGRAKELEALRGVVLRHTRDRQWLERKNIIRSAASAFGGLSGGMGANGIPVGMGIGRNQMLMMPRQARSSLAAATGRSLSRANSAAAAANKDANVAALIAANHNHNAPPPPPLILTPSLGSGSSSPLQSPSIQSPLPSPSIHGVMDGVRVTSSVGFTVPLDRTGSSGSSLPSTYGTPSHSRAPSGTTEYQMLSSSSPPPLVTTSAVALSSAAAALGQFIPIPVSTSPPPTASTPTTSSLSHPPFVVPGAATAAIANAAARRPKSALIRPKPRVSSSSHHVSTFASTATTVAPQSMTTSNSIAVAATSTASIPKKASSPRAPLKRFGTMKPTASITASSSINTPSTSITTGPAPPTITIPTTPTTAMVQTIIDMTSPNGGPRVLRRGGTASDVLLPNTPGNAPPSTAHLPIQSVTATHTPAVKHHATMSTSVAAVATAAATAVPTSSIPAATSVAPNNVTFAGRMPGAKPKQSSAAAALAVNRAKKAATATSTPAVA